MGQKKIDEVLNDIKLFAIFRLQEAYGYSAVDVREDGVLITSGEDSAPVTVQIAQCFESA